MSPDGGTTHAGTVTTDLHHAAPPGTRPLRGRELTRAWVGTVTAAEFLGFVVPAVVAAVTAGAQPAVAVPAVLAAGAVEGAILGTGQAAVLRRAIRSLDARRWTAATSVAAVVAYALGLAPSTLAGTVASWPPVLLVVAGVLLGSALLASIGTAQWLVLRSHVRRAYRWIGATATAWLAGLGVFLAFTMPLWHPGQPVPLVVTIGVAGGLLMAATTSVITGAALQRLLRTAAWVSVPGSTPAPDPPTR